MTRTTMVAALLALAGCTTGPTTQVETAGPAVSADNAARLRQVGAEVLFWNQAQRDANFPAMETLFPGHVVKAGRRVHPLPDGTPLPIAAGEVDAFMAEQNVAGLLVLQDGKVRLERYARGFGPEGRWTSFSVAKSFTSTLVGAALKDGKIRSLDDPITSYVPELAGSGYDGVTVRQLLTMTSGVRWNEDYTDPQSDVARMFTMEVPAGADPTVAYMRTLPRADPPGSKWVYKTGETNLIGVVVARAVGKPLATYLSEKLWVPFGMERDAFWMVDQSGHEVSGCCLSVSLRDYGRMGLYALKGDDRAVPAGWFSDATAPHVGIGRPGYGYGYQWWTYPEGRFGAQGIFGQSITIDPARKLVIVQVSAWPRATGNDLSAARAAFQAKLIAASGS
ncbi:serine hydrolase domain-containing protein [Sphingomonas sp.]|uniref:serine hydrolase domain-containing protein n=1 Tax=Sphingomonas sp. TaxID=28214 RepID=UPI002BF206DE|nr:serine hydrolase domain-containing protein [Sphingomonas sp.]HWK35946.1 serine hydrolase domain-containing protein [Sphingomonas sp.]